MNNIKYPFQFPIYSKKISNITPVAGEDFDAGKVELQKPGILKGQALLNGETDHTGIDVYVPGTSFLAKTDREGNFALSNIPTNFKYSILYNK